jgi:hypothetical protein
MSYTVVSRSRSFLATLFVPGVSSLGILLNHAATITMQTNVIGVTPSMIAYNSGHFYPGSNTRDWWRYSGVNGARVFITASIIEPGDDIAGRGDGVTDQTSFVARKTALRADPLNTTYINWPYFNANFSTTDQHGSNILNPTNTCSQLRQIGVNILICEGATEGTFPLSDTNDWPGIWELWQHYYAQSFYMARYFDVQRYQVFNEPNLISGLMVDEFYFRVKVVSDAVQSAIADVNAMFGKNLTPMVYSPVAAGTASSTYGSWGQILVTNRHVDMFGTYNAGYNLIREYDYHEYNSSPANFGAHLSTLNTSLTGDMSPEPRYGTSVSEFNVHTAGTFDTLPDTEDSPNVYATLGSILVNLTKNSIDDLYLFKFSQTLNTTTVKKNGLHFVDNTNAPYNIGGITKAGEVYRLFAQGAASGRNRLNVSLGSGATSLDVTATYDPVSKCYTLFSANLGPSVALTLDVSALGVPAGQPILLQEVSENCWGGAKALLTTSANQISAGTQPTNTVWLFTIPTKAEEPVQTLTCTDDSMVQDGLNKLLTYGANTNCIVRNSSVNTALRSATLMKFHVPLYFHPDTQIALLTVRAASLNGATNVQAHVYGLSNTNWSQSAVTWNNAPNLAQNKPAGANYTNNFILDQGNTAQLVGELVADNTYADRYIDVTKYLSGAPGQDVAFLLAREARFQGDAQDNDGMSIVSREGNLAAAPRLIFVRLKDTDQDGISDEAETTNFNTNPNNPDTDNDGFTDGQEILLYGTNPGSNAVVAPTLSNQPASQAVFVNDTANFSVTASGTPPLSYQWYYNQTNLVNAATNSNLTLPNVQLSQAGTYRVVVSNQAGSISSSNAVLTVQIIPPPPLPLYDGFAYSPGSALADQGGWQLNGGSSGSIEAGSLSTDGLASSIGNRVTWGSASMSLRLPLGTNMTSGVIYFSCLMRVDTLGTAMTGSGTLAGFASGTTTLFGTKVNIQTNSGGGFQLGTSKYTGTTFGAWATNIFHDGDTIFIVGRYTFNGATSTDDTCDLWLNPPSTSFGGSVPPTPSVAGVGAGGNDITPIDRFFLRGGGSTTTPVKTTADEVRLGLAWADVTTPLKPILDVSRSSSNLVLTWATNSAGFTLQSASGLTSPITWNNVTSSFATTGTNYTYTVPATNSARFFRLAR